MSRPISMGMSTGERKITTYKRPSWEAALSAFLAQYGSPRTVGEYGRTLERFYATIAKPPDRVTAADVHAYCYSVGPSGREPSANTVTARLTALGAWYGFLRRMGLVTADDPTGAVRRPRLEPGAVKGLEPAEIKRLLRAIDRSTAKGRLTDRAVRLRDRALVLTFLYTGRRRTEVMRLKAGDVTRNGDGRVYYVYTGKGGKPGRRELPAPCVSAILDSLTASGKALEGMAPEERLFDVSAQGFYQNFQRYLRAAKLPPMGLHALRHSAAKLRRDAGVSIEQVGAFLDHASLRTTTTYLRRLTGQEDDSWEKVAALLD